MIMYGHTFVMLIIHMNEYHKGCQFSRDYLFVIKVKVKLFHLSLLFLHLL